MKASQYSWLVCAHLLLAGCGPGDQGAEESAPVDERTTPAATRGPATSGPVEIEPGLTMRVLKEGSGGTARDGQTAVVHYTGWLYDAAAPDHRGQKFDSSVDRGQHFEFPLGAGAVIAGWDRGVAGMQVGEVRELTISPELAYGERGAGTLIPPGATLVFEVELADVVDKAR
jgi:FKBP-type peptidyl-prolyl cis-trans isomerase